MKKYVPLLLLSLLFTQGCLNSLKSYTVKKNTEIDDKISTDINGIDTRLFRMLQENDYDALAPLLSDSLKSLSGLELKTKVLPRIQKAIEGRSFRVADDYYVNCILPGTSVRLHSVESEESYTITYKTLTRETYVSTMVISDRLISFLLTIVYGRINGEWKVAILQMGAYAMKEETALDFYKDAHILYKKGYYIDALLMMDMSETFTKPADKYMVYDSADAIYQYHARLKEEIGKKYKFPHALASVPTKPEIYNIRYEWITDGYACVVNYTTSIGLADSATLKKEEEMIHSNIGNEYPGIDSNEVIICRAFNHLPEPGKKLPDCYNFIHRKHPLTTR